MSPELVDAFERQWPDVAQRLSGMLAGKKVPADKRDDVVQETGLRLFGMWEKVDRARPVWPLVVTIALNLMRDEARRNREREIIGLVPDLPARENVEHEGLARIEFERVQEAMAKLSPAHRSVLITEMNPDAPPVPKPARNANKMMRLRARRALVTLLETAAVRAAFVGTKLREVFGFIDPTAPLRLGMAEPTAGPIAALALAVLSFGVVNAPMPTPAQASELPAADRAIAGSDLDAVSIPDLDAMSAELRATKNALAKAAAERAEHRAEARAERRAERKAELKKNAKKRTPKRTDPWDPPPPPEDPGTPLNIPLPIGKVWVAAEAGAGVIGARVGERGTGTPACVAGVEAPQIGCGSPVPQSSGGQVGGEFNVGPAQAGTSVEVETP